MPVVPASNDDAPAATAAPSTYPIGVPTSIDGEHVYLPEEAARIDLGHASFLVGGYTSGVGPSCPSQDNPNLPLVQRQSMGKLANCDGGASLYDSPRASPTTLDLWYLYRNPAGLPLPSPGLVVLRAHRHDAEAADCPVAAQATCDSAIVLDAIVWRSDGALPTASTSSTRVDCRLAPVDCGPALATTAATAGLDAPGSPPAVSVLIVEPDACDTIPDPPPTYDLCSAPSVPLSPGAVGISEAGVVAVTFGDGRGRTFVILIQPIYPAGPGTMFGLILTTAPASPAPIGARTTRAGPESPRYD
jgi:hypothetical protein